MLRQAVLVNDPTPPDARSLVTPLSLATGPRSFFTRALVVLGCVAGVVACSGAEEDFDDLDADGDVHDDDDGDDEYASTSDELRTAGPCAGKAIDRAVRCAQAKGARVLSYYRSPKEQERVRRENKCTNRCTGMAGCVRPTAGCTSSPHTRCIAVDLVNDGAPATRAQLRACGLAKTTMPHRNHYDLIAR
ncbi:MAG: hypothetical protein KIS78_03075 [Labilithrix sp.]|nr:hypothetical protein [Labilithrix sp.]MCW5831425.1 hypothetical protein [Labilithrix sp.]